MNATTSKRIGGWLIPLGFILPAASLACILLAKMMYSQYFISKQMNILTNSSYSDDSTAWLLFFVAVFSVLSILVVLLPVTTIMFFSKRAVFPTLLQWSIGLCGLGLIFCPFVPDPGVYKFNSAGDREYLISGLVLMLGVVCLQAFGKRSKRMSETFVHTSSNKLPFGFILRTFSSSLILFILLISVSVSESLVGDIPALSLVFFGVAILLSVWILLGGVRYDKTKD
jgi:hypothetical protein